MLGSGAKAAKPSFVSYISPEVRGRRVGAAGREGWRGGGAPRRVVPLPTPVLPPAFRGCGRSACSLACWRGAVPEAGLERPLGTWRWFRALRLRSGKVNVRNESFVLVVFLLGSL